MNLSSKICRAGRYFLPVLLAFGLATACSDDEVLQSPLDTPNVTNSGQTVSSLVFTWDAVSYVSSYSCELNDPNGVRVAGLVTTSTTACFTGLQPNTTYTLEVYAYAAVGGSNTTSKVATLTATTDAVVPLQMTKPEVEINGTTATLSWESVEHAVAYEYSYMQEDEEVTGSTTNTSLTLRNLPAGDYRLTVAAMPDEEDEAHSTSPAVAVTFSIVEEKIALWERAGTYYSSDQGSEWEAKLIAYNDGSYKLSAWFGVEGYDLDFIVEGTEMVVQNHYSIDDSGYYYVYTGRDDVMWLGIYPSGGYSEFSGDKDGGELWFYAYGTGSGGNESFVWQGTSAGATVDDLIGTYAEHTTGMDWTLNDYNGEEVDKTGM